MHKYVIVFSKKGPVKYISHLDLTRLFKRVFRMSGVELKYSEGYHPHPKMGICQPLSLGYEGERELIEFETKSEVAKATVEDAMSSILPRGVKIEAFGEIAGEKKSLAAVTDSAVYTVYFPLAVYSDGFSDKVREYLEQDRIIALKKQKKSKELKETDIKGKIRNIQPVENKDNRMILRMILDCGSNSNLSPELVISTFMEFMDIHLDRYEIDVVRNEIKIPLDYNITWM